MQRKHAENEAESQVDILFFAIRNVLKNEFYGRKRGAQFIFLAVLSFAKDIQSWRNDMKLTISLLTSDIFWQVSHCWYVVLTSDDFISYFSRKRKQINEYRTVCSCTSQFSVEYFSMFFFRDGELNILLIGDSNVGKTALAKRFLVSFLIGNESSIIHSTFQDDTFEPMEKVTIDSYSVSYPFCFLLDWSNLFIV